MNEQQQQWAEGWYPATDRPGFERRWDGQKWTGQIRFAGSTEEQPPEKKKGGGWKLAAALVGGLAVLVLIGNLLGGGDEKDEKEAAQTSASTQPTPAKALPSVAPVAPAITTPALPPITTRAAASTPDPRCKPGEERYDVMIGAGLLDGSLKLANSQMIIDDGMVFYAASTVRPDGKFENRSDVWIIDTIPYTSTGGARNTTNWSKASDRLKIYPDDERVQAVDNCVVQLTRN